MTLVLIFRIRTRSPLSFLSWDFFCSAFVVSLSFARSDITVNDKRGTMTRSRLSEVQGSRKGKASSYILAVYIHVHASVPTVPHCTRISRHLFHLLYFYSTLSSTIVTTKFVHLVSDQITFVIKILKII